MPVAVKLHPHLLPLNLSLTRAIHTVAFAADYPLLPSLDSSSPSVSIQLPSISLSPSLFFFLFLSLSLSTPFFFYLFASVDSNDSQPCINRERATSESRRHLWMGLHSVGRIRLDEVSSILRRGAELGMQMSCGGFLSNRTNGGLSRTCSSRAFYFSPFLGIASPPPPPPPITFASFISPPAMLLCAGWF